MNNFYLILILIILFLLIATVVLLGDLPSNRNTTLHRIHSYVTIDLATKITNHVKLLDLYLSGGKFTSPKSIKRLQWASGWIIPVFYLIVLTGSLNIFFKYTFPQIQELGKSRSVSRHYFLMIPIILTNYISFLFACLSDPGYLDSCTISHLNHSSIKSKFPHDKLIYATSKECPTCKTDKIPRSKHCSSCDRCVLMFDHHCIWLNNDVAYFTFRWFLLFLASTCIIFIYGAYLCFQSLKMYVNNSVLVPKDIMKLPLLSKYWSVIKHTTFSNEVSGILFILCILLFPLVALFLGQILHSVYLGVTTNEIGKWDYIEYLMQNHLLFKFSPFGVDNTTFLILSDDRSSGRPQFIELKSGVLFNSNVGGELKQVNGWNELENIYDKGFFNNLLERLIPSI